MNGKYSNTSGNAVKELQHPLNQDVRQEAPLQSKKQK